MNALNSKLLKSETPFRINIDSRELSAPTTDTKRAKTALGPHERQQFEKCEIAIRKGFDTFVEVILALLTIRDLHLYREEFPSFEAYCRERWAISRQYAWYLIGAAERIKLLPAGTKTPVNEYQVRPFLKLKPEAFPKAWEEVIARAQDGKITAALARSVVAQLAPEKRLPKPGKRRTKAYELRCALGGLLVLLSQAKEGIENGDKENALEAIERIESELIGMKE